MDCISGVLIYISTWAINNTDTFNYPRGRARLELIIVLICSVIMGVANIMMIIQSVESIINKSVRYASFDENDKFRATNPIASRFVTSLDN